MPYSKVILFSHDGSGLGHLRRICRIAQALQGDFATLIVTGMRKALWLIPDNCEFCYLPSWDVMRKNRAIYWEKLPWLDIDLPAAIELRSRLLTSIIETFDPDAIIVDYLPFGLHNELLRTIENTNAMKYLVLRGLIDTSDQDVFFNHASETIASLYDRIFIAADKRVINIVSEYNFTSSFLKKIEYVNYITQGPVESQDLRVEMGVGSKYTKWIVCSSGGGKFAENIIVECLKVSNYFPEYRFDIVCGPLSNFDLQNLVSIGENCHVHSFLQQLPAYHASCDLLVSTGGYNSILEAGFGGASIIVFPNQTGLDDEQRNNSIRFSPYFNIMLLDKIEMLHIAIRSNFQRNRVSLNRLEKGGEQRILARLKIDLLNREVK